ncbi:hypothetical protein AMECASPLE_013852, partial [Ameca splendens]
CCFLPSGWSINPCVNRHKCVKNWSIIENFTKSGTLKMDSEAKASIFNHSL